MPPERPFIIEPEFYINQGEFTLERLHKEGGLNVKTVMNEPIKNLEERVTGNLVIVPQDNGYLVNFNNADVEINLVSHDLEEVFCELAGEITEQVNKHNSIEKEISKLEIEVKNMLEEIEQLKRESDEIDSVYEEVINKLK